jgi:hypothetical protein
LSAAYWTSPLADSDFDHRLSQLVTELDNWGEVSYSNGDPQDGIREFRIEVRVPTFDSPGARLIYFESYAASPDGWILTQYQYNFVDDSRRRFFAYHHHPVASVDAGRASITHVHCRPLDEGGGDHYRGIWVDAMEAHYEFVSWAAEPSLLPDCRSLRPLVRL